MDGFLHSQDYDSRMFVTSHEAKEIVDDNTVVVVVDTNRPGYTECEELLYMTKTIVVLDHHRQSKDIIQNAVLSYIEPYASSAWRWLRRFCNILRTVFGSGISRLTVCMRE